MTASAEPETIIRESSPLVSDPPRTVSLLIPCIVDQVFPEMGLAMARVLESVGLQVTYSAEHTCCGQPAFNAGHWDEARQVAGHFLDVFRDVPLVVCPSGSCTAMVRHHYAALFRDDPRAAEAAGVGARVFEFSELLSREGLLEQVAGTFEGRVGFHHSCHGRRSLGLNGEPLEIMKRIDGFAWAQPEGETVCCGFGGLFSVKFPPVAAAMANSRLASFVEAGADTIVVNDPGCIMHLRQEAAANQTPVQILHLVEFLDRAMTA